MDRSGDDFVFDVEEPVFSSGDRNVVVAGEGNFEQDLEQLLAMGFEERLARGTLLFAGNFDDAVAMLISDNGVILPDAPRRNVLVAPLPRPEPEMSLIEPYGTYNGRCGYCKSPDRWVAFAFRSKRLSPHDYESLLTREFLRSGGWTYHHLSDRACCVLYQIRLPVDKWIPTNAQKKAKKKMQKYLNNGEEEEKKKGKKGKKRAKLDTADLDDVSMRVCNVMEKMGYGRPEKVSVRRPQNDRQRYSIPVEALKRVIPNGNEQIALSVVKEAFAGEQVVLCDAYIVLQDRKMMQQRHEPDQMQHHEEQDIVVAAPPPEKHVLDVQVEESVFTAEKFELYRKYQSRVHEEHDATEQQFQRCFCTTPIIRQPPRDENDHPFGMGTAHMTFRLDGKLVGVSVIDFCPNMLCSEYFFWDTDYRHLCIGSFSQVYELELTQRYKNLKYYNLMLHCPTSAKMSYKMKLKGTEILCPVTKTFVSYEAVKPLIEEFGFCRLAPQDVPEAPQVESLEDAMYDFYVEMNGHTMPYQDARLYLVDPEAVDRKLQDLVFYLGPELYKNFIVQLV